MIAEGMFIDKKGNLKRLPSSFYYEKYIFDYYKFESLNVFTKISFDTELCGHSKLVECNNLKLLLNILSFHNKLPKAIFEKPENLLFSNKYITDDIVAKIIKWCKDNGFPFAIFPKSQKKLKALSKELKPDTYFSFNILDFLYNINEIYSSYILCAFILGNIKKIEPNVYTSNSEDQKRTINDLIDLSNLSKTECKDLLERKYSKIQFQTQLSFDGGPHWIVKTQSLFDAAFYQLMLMIYSSYNELRICPLCREYFQPHDKRQKYCRQGCYAQRAYKRKIASNKKLNDV